MTLTPDDRLKAAFAADRPPARDYAFTAAVMQRVALRRLWRSLLLLAPTTFAVASVSWAVMPRFAPLVESAVHGLEPALAVATVSAFLALAGWRAIRPLRA